MTEEENGNTPEQPQALQMQMQLTPQGVLLTFPVNLGLDNDFMQQLVKAYLSKHPELVQEIAREAVAYKQQEQKLLQLVKQSRND
jgi:hypothetical protein